MSKGERQTEPQGTGGTPVRDRVEQRGYQPQADRPLNPQELKPPKGGSAIEPPSVPRPNK